MVQGIAEGRITQGNLSDTPFLVATSAERRPVLSISARANRWSVSTELTFFMTVRRDTAQKRVPREAYLVICARLARKAGPARFEVLGSEF